MNSSFLWRGALVVAIVGIAAYSLYPPGDSINLGLDLRGGIHLVLEVETEDALRAETNKDMDRLVEELEADGVTGVRAERLDENRFRVQGVAAQEEESVQDAVEDYLPRWSWRRQGEALVFERRQDEIDEIEDQAVRQALQTIRNRVDAFGVAEPVIQRKTLVGDQIVVQLPGVDDPARVKRLIKNTAFLEFRLVDYPPPGRRVTDRQEILDYYGGQLPSHVEIIAQDLKDESGDETIGRAYWAVERNQVITGRDLKTAQQGLGQFNQPVVNFTLTPEGARRFADVTGDNIGRGLAIILDGKVQSAPEIEARISDRGIIEGSFTQQEVEDLVTTLRSGALPAAITYLEERTVGPSLGQDSIDQGLRAGLAGGALVVLAMLVVYKLTGLIAILALFLNIVLVFGALAYFGATLTLPGIAGIILTIGMAVDANVLVFERIREELRSGRTVKSAVAFGFSKALSSILDANITTLIAAMFLFQFGTGPIRGFAVTLSIGILASVFTAVFNSRLIFDLFLSRRTRVEKISI